MHERVTIKEVAAQDDAGPVFVNGQPYKLIKTIIATYNGEEITDPDTPQESPVSPAPRREA